MNSCPGCGAEARATWCSSACHARSRRLTSERPCAGCGQNFYARPRELRKGGGKYCAVSCRRAHEASGSTEYARIGAQRAHRVIAEQMLGRPLAEGEVVHHRDGNKRNNDPSNLEVLPSHAAHMREHVAAGEWGIRSHEEAVALGRRSGEARRAKNLSPHCEGARQLSLLGGGA